MTVSMLVGTPRNNRVVLCVKAALAEPKLVDEYITLVAKKTGIPQFSVSLQDLEKSLEVLASSSVFWPKVRALGIGSKLKHVASVKSVMRRTQVRRDFSSSSESSSDSSSSSDSDGGMDLGFSEDEAAKAVPEPAARRKVIRSKPKRKPKLSAERMETSGEGSDSSSSSSSSGQEEENSGKNVLKKKLSGLAARRRAEKALGKEAAVPEVSVKPKPPPTVEVPPVEQVAEKTAGIFAEKTERKLRQPYSYVAENLRPSNSGDDKSTSNSSPTNIGEKAASPTAGQRSEPESKRARVDDEPKKADWSTDFGRLVRQAIDNRRVCPFRTLGLAPASSMAEVKKRWAKLCLLLHPDKAPAEWKAVPELVDANQAVNDAKRSIEQRFQAAALSKPQRPGVHGNPFTLDKGTFGKRRVEIRWNPSDIGSGKERVERYLVFIVHGNDPRRRDQMLNVGSVKEGTDPFFVIVEDDQRFARFFNSTHLTVSVLASNAAGNSDPLTVVVPLR